MLITTSQLVLGPTGAVISDGAVLVRDDVIVAAGPRESVVAVAPPDVTHWDFPGATALPGLIDGHVHLSFDGGDDPVGTMLGSEPDQLDAAMAQRARQSLARGVTTVRDLGDLNAGAIRLRDSIRAGHQHGPRILAAGAPLTPSGGHCWFFRGEVSGPEEIRAMVTRNIEAGADVIKVMASGGHITGGGAHMWESQFHVDELRLIVDIAGEAGLPVAAHAHGTAAIADAISAGVSTIEHCSWMVSADEVDRRDDLALAMAEQGIAACCTLCGNDWRKSLDSKGNEATRAFYDRISWLDSHGVGLITGTDAGIHAAVFDDFVGMLELYAWLGFPADRILELATVDSARGVGLAGKTGQVAAGMKADLLVVREDPLSDLSALRDVLLVVADGQAFPAADGSSLESVGTINKVGGVS